MNMTQLEAVKLKKLEAICRDPVLWAKACLMTVDNATKKIVPWTARWYQAEMLRDPSIKKVARCGRRTGGKLPIHDKLLEYCGGLSHPRRESAANPPAMKKVGGTFRDWTRGLSLGTV